MSNNKQSMKLYTEKQLLNTIEAIRDYLKNYPEKFHESMIEKHLKNLEPIEIPSDEEIQKESEWLDNPLERLNFQEGIKWMRDNLEGLKNLPLGSTLQGGNNEQQ